MAQTLSLTDITKDFGGGPVLAGISLDIEPGELVAVMGMRSSPRLATPPVPALVSATSASSSKTASSCRS